MSEQKTVELMDLEKFERGRSWHDLSGTVREVNTRIADGSERRRQREVADYAAVQHQVVGNEIADR